MRFDFDEKKSKRWRENPKRGIGFEEACELFGRPYYLDQRSDYPEQYRAIGNFIPSFSKCAKTMKARTIISSHSGKPQRKNESFMKTTHKKSAPVSAERIANFADEGEDVSGFFTNRGRMMGPIQRVNVDFASQMLAELDNAAEALNVSRQAVIKTLLRQALDQHYLAMAAAGSVRKRTRPAGSRD